MKSPVTELDSDDPGDDVGLRFQYQYRYAAINATRLVTTESEVHAIVCENHEDMLIERPSGMVVAVQVKTRELGQPPFRTTDNQAVKALERFCKLDTYFPGRIECFQFITNHVFWGDAQDSRNLPGLLAKLAERGHAKHLRSSNPVRELIDILSKRTGLTTESVAATLLKTKVFGRKDTLNSISKDLIEAVSACPGLDQQPYSVIVRIAKALQNLAAEASTKSLDGPVSELYAAGSDLDATIEKQMLAGKRIERAHVLKIIDEQIGAQQTFEALNITGLISPEELPRGLERMVLKMARGGVQNTRIQGMQDLAYAFQAMYMRWVRKYGPQTAGIRYEDLLALVKVDCVEAQVAAQNAADPYGPAMYDVLFDRLKERCQNESESLYGCRPEHLLGAAGLLTESCRAWWSTEFDPEVGP